MVNAKTAPYIVYFLVAAVILLALAAIIASRWGGASRQVQYITCQQTEEEHDFDLAVTQVGPVRGELPNKTFKYKVEVSGEDFHMVGSEEGKEFGEHIAKDGVHYERDPGDSWEQVEEGIIGIGYVYGLIDSRPAYTEIPSEYILCAREGGDATVVGKSTEREVVSGLDITWNYWSSGRGHLYKSHQVVSLVDGEDWEKTEITTEISGVGEPNTITAPTLGSS